jgi:hypothetical protein
MTLTADVLEQVRQRAHWACEYCGVTETDAGGPLTVDHHRPRSQGGTDDLDNLIYCCFRCNNHKGDYWPTNPSDPVLWNPRQDSVEEHWLLLADGLLHPLSPTGSFTLKRLQLNRPQLAANRLDKAFKVHIAQRHTHLRETLAVVDTIIAQRVHLTKTQIAILVEHRKLLKWLLRLFA